MTAIDIKVRDYTDTEIRDLITKGYQQVSARYRTVACTPLGMTAVEAMQKFHPEEYKELMERLETWAGSQWRRTLAGKEYTVEFESPADFQAFKDLGGETSW